MSPYSGVVTLTNYAGGCAISLHKLLREGSISKTHFVMTNARFCVWCISSPSSSFFVASNLHEYHPRVRPSQMWMETYSGHRMYLHIYRCLSLLDKHISSKMLVTQSNRAARGPCTDKESQHSPFRTGHWRKQKSFFRAMNFTITLI